MNWLFAYKKWLMTKLMGISSMCVFPHAQRSIVFIMNHDLSDFFFFIRVLSEARAISISLALFEMKLLCPIPFSSYPLSKPFGCYFFPANKTSFFNAECIWSEWIERKMKFNKVKLCQRQLSHFFLSIWLIVGNV